MQPSNDIVQKVRAALVLKGSSLAEFCRTKDLDRKNMNRFLRGEINSENAIAQREIVLKETCPELLTETAE